MRRMPMKLKADDNAASYEFIVAMPTTLEDTDAIVQRYGSVDRMIHRANAQWKVDAAPPARKLLPNEAAVQAWLDGFCANGTKSTKISISKEKAKEQGFSAKNVEYLKSLGISI